MARAMREVKWRSTDLAYSGIGLLTLGGLLGLLLTLSPPLVLPAVISVLPVFVIDGRTTRRRLAFWSDATPTEHERSYLRDLLVQPRWAKEVRAFGLERHLVGRFRALTNDLLRRLAAVYGKAARDAV